MATAAPPPDEYADDAPDAEVEEEDPEEVEPWLPSSDSEQEHPALKQWTPSPDSEPEQPPPPALTDSASADNGEEGAKPRWPGWPGASVFRLVVAAEKVGGLIGRRGETIKRLCEETRARVRVLGATNGVTNQIILISATEETQADLPPAMDAAIKTFKHVNEIEMINPNNTVSTSAPETCCAKLLVPSAQAVHLIGKQGIMIKSFQETTGATIRIIDTDKLLGNEIVDERIVKICGASLKVLNALKLVLGLLRKFLVDHGVLHLFERKYQAVARIQDSRKENQVTNDYAPTVNQNLLLSDCRSPLDLKGSRHLLYGRGPSACDPYSSDISHPIDSLLTKITQTMQIPLPHAEEIIGVEGQNIAHIRSVSGAVVVLEESRDYPNEVVLMIKGSSSQVQIAHQLVQDILSGNREPPPRSSYSDLYAGSRLLISRHGIPASPDYLPSYHEHQLPSERYGYSSKN